MTKTSTPNPDEPTPLDPVELKEQLDEEEKEFRALRRDLPGVKGAAPPELSPFRWARRRRRTNFSDTPHPEFRPIVPIVNIEVGMEKQYFAVTPDMVEPLKQIGITVTDHMLYLTVTSRGAIRIVPVRTSQCRRRAERIHPHQRDRPDPGHGGMGAAVHRP